jgi:hypothetical protein
MSLRLLLLFFTKTSKAVYDPILLSRTRTLNAQIVTIIMTYYRIFGTVLNKEKAKENKRKEVEEGEMSAERNPKELIRLRLLGRSTWDDNDPSPPALLLKSSISVKETMMEIQAVSARWTILTTCSAKLMSVLQMEENWNCGRSGPK